MLALVIAMTLISLAVFIKSQYVVLALVIAMTLISLAVFMHSQQVVLASSNSNDTNIISCVYT